MTEKKKVLFVDDNKMDRIILSKILKQLDLDFVETASAEEFLPKIKEYQPDLCLVDLNISQNNDGRVLVRAIRNILGDDLPIIIISAVEESEEIALNLKNGANDFVCKPIDKALLSSKIANYLKNQEIDARVLPLFKLPLSENAVITTNIEFELKYMTEELIGFSSSFHLTEGSTIVVENTFLKKLIEDEQLLVEVTGLKEGIYLGKIKELLPEMIPALRALLTKWQNT